MNPKITILGSGGWIPTESRETCSALLRWDNKGIIIDAGTGISHLSDKSLLDGVDELVLILTHFHLDHISGLAYLSGLLSNPPIIYAPANMLYETPSREIVERAVSSPYHPVPLGDTFKEIRELQEENEILGLRILARKQPYHSIETAALVFEDWFAYLTDTSFDSGNIAFANEAPILFHEAWYVDSEEDWGTHSSGREAGQIAKETGADQLYLIHNNPLIYDDRVLKDAQKEFPNAAFAFDKQTIFLK